jgi:hypothetical protein
MEALLYNLFWFVFVVWGLFAHYLHYTGMISNFFSSNSERYRAWDFSELLWDIFSCQSRIDALDMISEQRTTILKFVDHVLNEYIPETSIFSGCYLKILLYRTKCQVINTPLQRRIDDVSKVAHMFFMLIVMDIKNHGKSTHTAYRTKFSKSFQTFVQLLDFEQFVSKINEIGRLLKEIHDKLVGEEDALMEATWKNMYQICVRELQFLLGPSMDCDELANFLRDGGTYAPSIPDHLLEDTI